VHGGTSKETIDGNVVSGNFYSAQPFGILNGVDYKYTGFVRRVEVDKIRQVHNSHDICLLTTLGVSPSGEVFNVDSESLAACVAGALGASKIIFFTDRNIVVRNKDHGKQVQHLRLTDARNVLDYNKVSVEKRGLVLVGDNVKNKDRSVIDTLTKIGFSIVALESGVKRAHIIAPTHGSVLQELYTRDGSGTLISRDLYEGIRRATVNDISGICDLIQPLIQAGTLVDRPRDKLEKDIESYYVYTRDNLVVACAQLKRFENDFAEIGCLVVSKDYRSQGRGDAMLGYLERICLQNNVRDVFVLSTQTMEWFVERGFDEVDVPRLPPSRQATYNWERNSKIYMKHIDDDRELDASELWWNR
jgi:amino-acid N-acetyltransferase